MSEKQESIPYYKPFCNVITSPGEKPSSKKQTLRVMVLSDKKVEFGKIFEGDKPVVDDLKNFILPITITDEILSTPSFETYEKPFNETTTESPKATLSCRVNIVGNELLKTAEEEDDPVIIINGEG